MASGNQSLREHAKRFGLPFCEKRGAIVTVLDHKENDFPKPDHVTPPFNDFCPYAGCCYPCFTEGVMHEVKFCKRGEAPLPYVTKCTRNLHNYAYFADLTDKYFLVGKETHQIPQEVWERLEKYFA